MSYYPLKEDVYLVRGAARACLYDLAKGILFSVNNEIANFIDSLSHEEKRSSDYLSVLLSEDLITEVNALQPSKSIKSLAKKYPLEFAWIEVTRQCNLACTFCYEGSNPSCVERMSFNDFKQVVDNLVEAGIAEIQFIGGEPTILKDELKAMIRHARPHFNFIEVYTNGITINDAWCEFFKEYKVNVAVSIHSYIAEEHDRITTIKGSHKRVLRGLNLLKKYDIPYRIGTIRNKSCKIGEHHEDYGYRLEPSTPKATGMADALQFDLEMFRDHAITKETKRFPISKEKVITALSGHQCFVKEIYISSLLDVFPCVMERRRKHGNLNEKNLVTMIDEKLRYLSKDNINGCKDCEYRYGCFDCRPDSNGNDFLAKPWHCTYDPITGIWHDLEGQLKYIQKRSSLNSIPIVVDLGVHEPQQGVLGE